MRIGQGYDIHPLREGRPLILGGILIPHSQGLEGHSDADGLTHAVCDALLGAMGEGDLGTRYPSSNSEYKNLSSLVMLRSIADTLAEKQFRLVNLDTVIMAQFPKLAPYIKTMKESLAETLQVPPSKVNVKVKSGEGIGMVGRAEGIATLAICLIECIHSE